MITTTNWKLYFNSSTTDFHWTIPIGLVATHCIVPRLALASGSAADMVRYLLSCQRDPKQYVQILFKFAQQHGKVGEVSGSGDTLDMVTCSKTCAVDSW